MDCAKHRWITDALAFTTLSSLEEGTNLQHFMSWLEQTCIALRTVTNEELLLEGTVNDISHRKRLLLICLTVKLTMSQVDKFEMFSESLATDPLLDALNWLEKIKVYFPNEQINIYLIIFETLKAFMCFLLENGDEKNASILLSNYEDYLTLQDCNKLNVLIAMYTRKNGHKLNFGFISKTLAEIGKIHAKLKTTPFLIRLQNRVGSNLTSNQLKNDDLVPSLLNYQEKLDNLSIEGWNGGGNSSGSEMSYEDSMQETSNASSTTQDQNKHYDKGFQEFSIDLVNTEGYGGTGNNVPQVILTRLDTSELKPSYSDPSYLHPSVVNPSHPDPPQSEPSDLNSSHPDPPQSELSDLDPSHHDTPQLEPFQSDSPQPNISTWSIIEDGALIEGVERWGENSWMALHESCATLHHKLPSACKNRWLELTKISSTRKSNNTKVHQRKAPKMHVRRILSPKE